MPVSDHSVFMKHAAQMVNTSPESGVKLSLILAYNGIPRGILTKGTMPH